MRRISAPSVRSPPARTSRRALPAPLKQHDVRNAPVNPVTQTAKPASTAPAADKVTQLANSGNPVALTILGLRDLDGTNGTAVNLPDAVKFLSEAAEKGQAVAQYRLGTLYERGQGVTADPAKAAHWYEMAANQGNRKAMHNLAVSYASGAAGKKNMAEAARWFAKAAALGCRIPSSILRSCMNAETACPRACSMPTNGIRLQRQRAIPNPSSAWVCCRPS